MKRLLTLGTAFSVGLVPSLALACPQCAARQSGGLLENVALGALLFLPFAAAALVMKIIRAHGDDGAEQAQTFERLLPILDSSSQQDRKRRQAE